MKAVDVVIGIGAAATLALAGYAVYRAHGQDMSEPVTNPVVQFAPCRSMAGRQKVMCQVDIARKAGQAHCIGGRLFHVYRDAKGHRHSDPWPKTLHCQATDVQPTPPASQ
ncbi:hypothetical protein [Oleiagrimonas sp. C23AA]|uniref:hypothetical protein n=1 Tax=Oleiagrimonas sp. C23AA TaxID=2719047 RepID=UPI001422D8AC|nr:hypothetical protein [Oleiagrimonas sp. C23AA]NII09403.1 hypothetical protein [Oleiagrimonas sp. C23AA]